MRERGKKPMEAQNPSNFSDFNYSAPDLICRKHPKSSPIGICPLCLRERLLNLICPDCGEQRSSACSCSAFRNSSVSDVGSVGRISFLLENEQKSPVFRASRTVVESDRDEARGAGVSVKRSGIWGIVRLFRKRREKLATEMKGDAEGRGGEIWVFDHQLGVSRSRSLCSFRGGGGSFHESSSDFAFSSAKISDFNSSSERASNFSEAEPRKSSFENRGTKREKSGFQIRESDFRNIDESAFIDLKLDLLPTEEKAELSGFRGSELLPLPISDSGNLRRGGSCRITVRETGVKRDRRGKRVWRWILKHNSSWRSRSKREDEGSDVFRA